MLLCQIKRQMIKLRRLTIIQHNIKRGKIETYCWRITTTTTTTATPALATSRRKGIQILKSLGQVWRKMIILLSIEMNRYRLSKGIVWRNWILRRRGHLRDGNIVEL